MSGRDDTIRGLHDLADFLAAHPDLPAPDARTFQYSVDVARKTDERRSEVDRVATILGVEPVDTGHYAAERSFSGVIYRAVSCSPGPKQGLCVMCRTNAVRSLGADGLAGKLCTPCLGDQADVIDPQGGAS